MELYEAISAMVSKKAGRASCWRKLIVVNWLKSRDERAANEISGEVFGRSCRVVKASRKFQPQLSRVTIETLTTKSISIPIHSFIDKSFFQSKS